MVMEDLFTRRETFSKANGLRTKLMVMGCTPTMMAPFTRGTGLWTSKMGLAKKFGLISRCLRVTSKMGSKRGMVNSTGRTVVLTKEPSTRIC